MGKKKTGCSFRIRSPYVREFLAETIGNVCIKINVKYFDIELEDKDIIL